MKRKLIPSILAIVLLVLLSACGGDAGPQQSGKHFYDLYPHGILTPEERESREEMKRLVSDSLPKEMHGQITGVNLRQQHAEVSISYSNELVKSAPDNWAETVEDMREVSGKPCEQERNTQPTVLYVCDSKKILLTVKDGELLYNRFKEKKKPEAVAPLVEYEAERDRMAADLKDRIAKLEAEDAFDEIMSPSSSTVYVSDRSKTIHSISDCSGMKNYTAMPKEEADSKGYKYCPNCW